MNSHRSMLLWCFIFMSGAAAEVVYYRLNGNWQVVDYHNTTSEWIHATVPGCIHTDLLAAQKIFNPFFRDQEKEVQWVGEKAWQYHRIFSLLREFLDHDHILLRCEGLDTFATVMINGVVVGHTDNMFRTWEFDVKPFLHVGENEIDIIFDSVLPFMREQEKQFPLPSWSYPGASYVRKTPCNFGWDWGPTLITCGIWRPLELMAYSTAKIDDVHIMQDHTREHAIMLQIEVASKHTTPQKLYARMHITDPQGNMTTTSDHVLEQFHATITYDILSPLLWWPAGMGDQHLYQVSIDLMDEQGNVLDTVAKRIGLRTVHVVQPHDDTPFHFVVNGVPCFAKGSNWIPSDTFSSRITKEKLRQYVQDARAANMNCLRFWGGGYYEEDELFDACDEMGICVWLDCKFSCATYPSFDARFLENVRHEIRDNLRRLRHHPSLAICCGNNEVARFRADQWAQFTMSASDYFTLFADAIGAEMAHIAPEIAYVTGSPDCGDVHSWGVWHKGDHFEAFRDVHGFVSEFGFQSFPVPTTIDAFTLPEDRIAIDSDMMKWHERDNRWYMEKFGRESRFPLEDDGTLGTAKLMRMMSVYFSAPKDFESTLWLSQILQAYGIEYGIEGWRRDMPRSMGCLYWQLNDIWPGTTWSSIDYFGRWKALHFRARHFFEPIHISGVAHVTEQQVAVWVTNDQQSPHEGEIIWNITDCAGKILRSGTQDVIVPAILSQEVAQIDLHDELVPYQAHGLLIWLQLKIDNTVVSQSLVLLAKPRELALTDPCYHVEVGGETYSTEFTVTVTTQHAALWTWIDVSALEPDARYGDNFVHMLPNAPVSFQVTLSHPVCKHEFEASLRVSSLYDTYA
jgi:beta-mannosidase